MNKIKFSITINAPKEKVWNTMLNEDTYSKWTSAFSPDSRFEGDWNKGSKIRFIGSGPDGKIGGMVSHIVENKPFEYISIEHLGIVREDGSEDITSDEVKTWAGAHENYLLKEDNGITEVIVDMDSNEEMEEMFKDMWPKALHKLKEIVEK